MKCTICKQYGGKVKFGTYIYCSLCKSLFLEKQISSQKLLKENDKYASSVITHIDSISESLELPIKRLSLLTKKIKKGSNILDVGCGYGLFLDLVTKTKYIPYGMDVAVDFIKHLRKKKIQGYTKMNDVPNNYFDAITAFDVIEHVGDPLRFIQEIKSKLKTNGYLMLSTPNLLGISGKVLKHRWWVFNPSGHFTLFSIKSLRYILEKNGFEIIDCKTNSITQWFVPNDTLIKKIANKILYIAFSIFEKQLITYNLGDNIEMFAKLKKF